MISTLSAFAPAGVLGSGSVDVRPGTCAAVRPALAGVVAAVPGSGLPVSGPATGMSPRLRGAVAEANGAPTAFGAYRHIDLITQNDGTTLGIHSPGRPQS